MGMQEALAKLETARRPDLVATTILWVGVGWLFGFQSQRYMETRSFLDRVVGGYELVTERGEMVGFSGARHWQEQLIEWSEQNGVRDRVLDWVVEQRDIFVAAASRS
jgi:hypothetical protein